MSRHNAHDLKYNACEPIYSGTFSRLQLQRLKFLKHISYNVGISL